MNSFKNMLIVFTLILLNSIVFSSITVSADGTSGGACSGGGWTIFDLVILFVFIAALVLILAYMMKFLSSE